MDRHEPPVDQRQPKERKRPYSAPRLTEYGSVAKLTQGSGSSASDPGGGFRKTSCL
jgi:hypothetical protein